MEHETPQGISSDLFQLHKKKKKLSNSAGMLMEGNTTYRFLIESFRREIRPQLKMAGSEGSFKCNTIFPYGVSQSKFPESYVNVNDLKMLQRHMKQLSVTHNG